MEENFQKSSSGHHCHTVRTRSCDAGKSACVAVVFEEGCKTSLDVESIVQCAREIKGHIHAYYCIASDLGRYGRLDQLAPASDMEMFENYVHTQNMERAYACFACLQQGEQACTIHILYGIKSLRQQMAHLQKQYAVLHICMYSQ